MAFAWEGAHAPWLSSLLVDVGAPEGWALSGEDIANTGSALRISPSKYEGRLEVYVHAGVPDLEHDPRPHSQPFGAIGDYRLHRAGRDTVEIYHATGKDVWLSLYAYGAVHGDGVVWRSTESVERWIRDMLVEIGRRPIPLC